jgi:pyruvate/2-oxoglutarate dehydrogenase complex dihydrolipoamide dehydrogenase (E3) component
MTHYDAIVVGSGQCGTPIAKAFADAGKKTAIVERAHVGGTCVNEGCTPTKTMIASGRVAHLTRRSKDYGVHYVGDLQVDLSRVRQRKRDIVESFSSGGKARLEKAGVDILMGEATFDGPRSLSVKMNDGGDTKITGEHIFVNVGERPTRPSISGLDSVDPALVLDSTSVMELDKLPAHLVVIGGGYIGLEFGQLFRRLGAEVTIVQRGRQLLPREDADVAECMLKILQEDGVNVHLSTTVESLSGADGVNIQIKAADGAKTTIPGSHLLLAVGRTPNSDSLNLGVAGVETTPKGHIVVNDKLETSTPGVYAIGDVHGGPAFTHISYDDFRIVRHNFLGESVPATTPALATVKASRSRTLTPYVVYTDPQLGHVGLHAHEAPEGRKTKTASMPMTYVARALETDETRGMMKATVDAETGEILGFTCLGIEGGEVMAVVQTAMMGGLRWWDLEAAVWAHPSLAESLNNLWGFLE